MVERTWENTCRKTLVCVDSYHKGVLAGRLYNAGQGPDQFESLSQFLNKMDALLDGLQMPQSFTERRRFLEPEETSLMGQLPNCITKGSQATFELSVIFRQHTSWQGTIVWLDNRWEQSFRSVLELVFLMDSALRKPEGSGTV